MTEKQKLEKIIIDQAVFSLKKNFFDVIYCENKIDTIEELKKIINSKSVIGYGGSKSLEEIGFFEIFKPDSYPNLLDRKNTNLTIEQKKELQDKALTADFFLSSANALSQTGEIVLIDKWGNRSGGMTYGPKKRIFIIGKNKIEPDLNYALLRAQNKASIMNNLRFGTKNPCTKSGECSDCENVERLCCITTIIHRCQPPKSILVIIVNEDLGF